MENHDLSLKLFVVMSKAMRSISDRVEEDIRRYNLNPTEFAVLELLFHKGDQPIQQIGKKILLASGSITYVVDKLEKKQLIIRKPCPNDRRVIYAVITEEGIKLMEKIFPEHEEAIHEIFNVISDDEKLNMIEKLKQLGINQTK